jgi:group I intron endonuclease
MAYAREGYHCCNQRNMGVSRIYGLYYQGELRYVGQTTHSIRCRLCSHVSKARKPGKKTPVTCWILSLLKKGERPEIKLIEEVEINQADQSEKFWIDIFRDDRLKNFSDGGNMCGFLGKKHTEEARFKMRAAAQKRVWSMSETARKQLSERNKTRKQTFEEIEKRRQKLIGQKRSAAYCKKQSERMLKTARRKAVIGVDASGQEFRFSSVREAGKKMRVAHVNISRAAKNPRFSSAGLNWRYADGN